MRFFFSNPTLAGIAIVCIILVLMIVNGQYRVGVAEDEARQGFLAVCERDQPKEGCEQRLEAEHRRCFGSNYVHGGRFSTSFLNIQEYRQCVSDGYEAWNRRRRERGREAENFKRETLG